MSVCLGTHFFEILFWNPCHRNPFFKNPFSSESIFSESNQFFRNPFFSESLFSESIFFGIHFFGIHFFGIHFFGIHFFGIHFSEFIFGTRAKTRKNEWKKTRISENGCVSLLCANGEDFGIHFSEPPILAFLIFGGCGEVHASIQVWGGGLWGGGVWQLNWVWLGFWDFGRECLRVCLEVLENYDSRAEEPSIQFQGTTILRVFGLFYSLSAWFRPYKGSLLETFWIICLSLSNTHPRDQIRGTCVRIREGDGPQNK